MGPTLYEVERIGNGFLAVMAKPVADEWIDEEFAGIAAAGVKQVVSLLEPEEAYELGLAEEERLCAKHGMEFISYPLPDRGLPHSVSDFAAFTWDRYCEIVRGKNTVVHCRAGIGRAGLVAAAVLLFSGFEAKAAFAHVSRARCVTVPDTPEQYQWLVDIKHVREIVTFPVDLTAEQEEQVRKLSTAELEEIDRRLLSNVVRQWRKVARVVAETMFGEAAGGAPIPEALYLQRITSLAESGLVESQGDLRRMRFSEIRLPRDPS